MRRRPVLAFPRRDGWARRTARRRLPRRPGSGHRRAGVRQTEASIREALVAAGAPGAAVAVVSGDRVIWAQGLGVANTETGAPVTADTLFQIGSATKMFTAAAMLSAAASGAVALDRPVGGYVSGLAPCLAAPTLAQLLSHTGGVMDEPDEYGPQGEEGLAAYARTLDARSTACCRRAAPSRTRTRVSRWPGWHCRKPTRSPLPTSCGRACSPRWGCRAPPSGRPRR